MAKLSRKVGSTSQVFQLFIQDSSSTIGAGLTGLAFNTASLTAFYHRDTDTTATVISLVTMTVGTFTSSGFREIDATNMPGWYQFCPPDVALASGAANVGFHLKGATNMAPVPLEVDLDAQADVTFWNGTVVATPATAGIPDVNVKNISGAAVSTTSAQIGVNVVTVASAASNIKKNQIFDLSFPMTDAVTHAPTTGYTVTPTRSIDGAAFAACANAVTEVGVGVYNITLAAADTNGNAIMYRFTAPGADDRLIEIITQP